MYFDLDGTLWDATESTAKAWTEVFAQLGYGISITSQHIRKVAGMPYLDCLQSIVPDIVSSTDIQNILLKLENSEKKWMENLGGELYPGVLEGLENLATRTDLFLVSNCNTWYLNSFLEQFGFEKLFKTSICHGSTGLVKSENLKALMKINGHKSGYYIGDTAGDQKSSLEAGLEYIHAEYGFAGNSVIPSLSFNSFESIEQFLLEKII